MVIDAAAALPPDVRKGFAFPYDSFQRQRGYASRYEAKPLNSTLIAGRAEPFRTSGGKAALTLLPPERLDRIESGRFPRRP